MAPERGALRLTRVALFALAVVGLACAAHLTGGETVSPVAMLVAVPAVMVVINLLASRRRGPLLLIVATELTQAVLHVAFMTLSLTRGCQVVAGPMPAMPGAAGHVAVSCGEPMSHGTAAAGLWPSPTMLLAHGLAGLIVALLLAHGERALWGLAGLLRLRFTRPEVSGPVPVRRALPVMAAIAGRPRPGVARRGVRRRGPPEPARATVFSTA